VATIGLDSAGARNGARPSISLHPAFPAVVAMWFASLLGAGSLVLPADQVGTIVEMSGLAALVPAAAPPLGLAARGLIAAILAILGARAGVAIARRVARAQSGGHRSQDTGFAAGVRRPISANEELGSDSLIEGVGLPVAQEHAPKRAADDRANGKTDMAPLPDDDEPLRFSAPSLARRAPAEDLALVQLVQDLDASIERRREALAAGSPAPWPGRAAGVDRSPAARHPIDAALRAALATLQRASEAA